jgi:hypothetical protein
VAFALAACGPALHAAAPRRALMFSIDQGWANGPVQNGDIAALGRVATSLKAFQQRFDTYALLSCAYQDRGRLTQTLDMLAHNDIRFMLDVYASDTMSNLPGNRPADPRHGVAMTIADLQALKKRYGASFAGIRVFEVFSINFSILETQKNGRPWLTRIKDLLPSDDFFQPEILRTFFKFAYDNKMSLVFSDWFWSGATNSAFLRDTVHQPQNEAALAQLARAYPGTAIVLFANNVPGGAQAANWDRSTRRFLQDGAAGIGLSDQSWLCRQQSTDSELNCPVSLMIDWAETAYKGGAALVQTEPYWYWWNFPKGLKTDNYASVATSDFGTPRDTLRQFAAAFGVRLAAQK